MRKWGALAIGGVLLISLATPVNAAAPKAGATCTKKNATATSAGKLYTCILSGKKLVWNKGVAVPKPIPSPTKPTAIGDPIGAVGSTPSPTPTPTSTPTTFIPLEPTNILNLDKEYEGVAYWAWKKSSDQIASASSLNSNFEIVIGPNSGILNKFPKEATDLTSKLYSSSDLKAKNYFVSFSHQDSDWAEKKLEELLADQAQVDRIRKQQTRPEDRMTYWICPSVEKCHSSTVAINKYGISITLAGFTPSRTSDINETQGWLQSHEYAHIIQNRQFLGTSREDGGTISTGMYMPDWMIEGGADFSAYASTHHASLSDYLKARQTDIERVPKQNAAWFENFLTLSDAESSKLTSGEIYNIGFMVNEIFASLKGPNVQMELFKAVAKGKSFDQAFEDIFGTPWKSAVPIIARVLANVRAKG